MFRNASLSCCWQLHRRNLCEEAIHQPPDLQEHHSYTETGQLWDSGVSAVSGVTQPTALPLKVRKGKVMADSSEWRSHSLSSCYRTAQSWEEEERTWEKSPSYIQDLDSTKILGNIHFPDSLKQQEGILIICKKFWLCHCRTTCFLSNASTAHPGQHYLSCCITYVMYCFRWTTKTCLLSLWNTFTFEEIVL